MKAFTSLLILCFVLFQYSASGQASESKWNDKVQYQITLDALFEKDEVNEGASLSALYFLKEKIGVGPVISYRRYSTQLDESMLNLGIEAVLLDKSKNYKVVPFGAFSSGIGVPLYDGGRGDGSTALGSTWYIQPKVGIHFLTQRDVAIHLSIGYIHQGLDINFDRSQADLKLTYNRYVLSMGIAF